jgi:hypothetical protein
LKTPIAVILMETVRFWTGAALLVGLAAMIVMAISDRRVEPAGRIEGMVLLRGRPLKGGTIYFDSDTSKPGECTWAPIDEEGHFHCDPAWQRDRTRRMHYRVRIVLGPRNFPPERLSTAPVEGSGDGVEARPGPGPAGDRHLQPRVVKASLEGGDPDSPRRSVGSDAQQRISEVRIAEREVWLGPEPARVDIDLRD